MFRAVPSVNCKSFAFTSAMISGVVLSSPLLSRMATPRSRNASGFLASVRVKRAAPPAKSSCVTNTEFMATFRMDASVALMPSCRPRATDSLVKSTEVSTNSLNAEPPARIAPRAIEASPILPNVSATDAKASFIVAAASVTASVASVMPVTSSLMSTPNVSLKS